MCASEFRTLCESNIRTKCTIPSSVCSNSIFEYRNGILFQKLFRRTVTKHYSSNREKLLKMAAEGQEFAKSLRSQEQFIQTVKGQNNFWTRMLVSGVFQISYIQTIQIEMWKKKLGFRKPTRKVRIGPFLLFPIFLLIDFLLFPLSWVLKIVKLKE